MKFNFKIQQYQTDAVENTVSVFTGQPSRDNALYRRDLGNKAAGLITYEMMEEMKASGLSQEEMDAILADMPIIEQTPMTVVTNEHTMNGAAVFFYPDQMDKIAEQLGGDYFILPSSVHELLVIPDNGEFDHEGLRGMVQEEIGRASCRERV